MDFYHDELIDDALKKQMEWLYEYGWYIHKAEDDTGKIYDVHTHGLDETTNVSIERMYKKHTNFRFLNAEIPDDVDQMLQYLVSQVQSGDIFHNRDTFDYNNETFILHQDVDEFGDFVLDIKKMNIKIPKSDFGGI